MLFSVCQNSIGKYDFYTVALYAPLRVLQVAKSTVLLGLNTPKNSKRTKIKSRMDILEAKRSLLTVKHFLKNIEV